jgi:hypothetical protein
MSEFIKSSMMFEVSKQSYTDFKVDMMTLKEYLAQIGEGYQAKAGLLQLSLKPATSDAKPTTPGMKPNTASASTDRRLRSASK